MIKKSDGNETINNLCELSNKLRCMSDWVVVAIAASTLSPAPHSYLLLEINFRKLIRLKINSNKLFNAYPSHAFRSEPTFRVWRSLELNRNCRTVYDNKRWQLPSGKWHFVLDRLFVSSFGRSSSFDQSSSFFINEFTFILVQ